MIQYSTVHSFDLVSTTAILQLPSAPSTPLSPVTGISSISLLGCEPATYITNPKLRLYDISALAFLGSRLFQQYSTGESGLTGECLSILPTSKHSCISVRSLTLLLPLIPSCSCFPPLSSPYSRFPQPRGDKAASRKTKKIRFHRQSQGDSKNII